MEHDGYETSGSFLNNRHYRILFKHVIFKIRFPKHRCTYYLYFYCNSMWINRLKRYLKWVSSG